MILSRSIFGRDEEKKTVFYESPHYVQIERFYIIYKYLLQSSPYDYVLVTDVRDIVFQSDPVEWLRENLGDKMLVAGGESIRYCDEPWNQKNMIETYGPNIYDLFKECEVYNVGTLGGTGKAIKDLALNIYTASINRQIPIVDQSTFNVLIQSAPYKDIVKFARLSDGWACQAGATADPDKIDQFRAHLIDREPVFDKGVVKTADGRVFPIVHQYDRVPAWKKFFLEKYASVP